MLSLNGLSALGSSTPLSVKSLLVFGFTFGSSITLSEPVSVFSWPTCMRYCVISPRRDLNFSSWFMAALSLGRGKSTINSGPKVALGPGFKGMIRSAMINPSSTSLVIKTTVFFSCCQIRTISSCKLALVNASSALRGSSSNKTRGLAASARATLTR